MGWIGFGVVVLIALVLTFFGPAWGPKQFRVMFLGITLVVLGPLVAHLLGIIK